MSWKTASCSPRPTSPPSWRNETMCKECHIVCVEMELKDRDAIQAACKRRGLPVPVQGKANLFSGEFEGFFAPVARLALPGRHRRDHRRRALRQLRGSLGRPRAPGRLPPGLRRVSPPSTRASSLVRSTVWRRRFAAVRPAVKGRWASRGAPPSKSICNSATGRYVGGCPASTLVPPTSPLRPDRGASIR
jgi:hypothetical protein